MTRPEKSVRQPCPEYEFRSTLQAELVTVNSSEGAAFGTALLAGVSAGAWKDVPEACEAVIKITSNTSPDPKQVEVYAGGYPLYRELYPALKTSFAKLAD